MEKKIKKNTSCTDCRTLLKYECIHSTEYFDS